MCLTVALPAPEAEKEQVAPATDEALEGSETGFYGGWGRRKWIESGRESACF